MLMTILQMKSRAAYFTW